VRIAVLNGLRRHVGGVETYLAATLPQLAAAGHELMFWCEQEGPQERPVVPLPEGTVVCCSAARGREAAVRELLAWSPDVVFSQGLGDPSLEAELQRVAPGIVLAHNYFGTCISGQKAHQFPAPCPCQRTFGAACLLQYYPRRCGGWNPATLWRLYRLEAARLRVIRQYRGVVTLSSHMRQEYLRHGLSPDRVWHIPCCLSPRTGAAADDVPTWHTEPAVGVSPWALLYLGRMERLKGGAMLLEALPALPGRLGRPVHLTFAGDGRERPAWEARAREVCAAVRGLTVEFAGWVEPDRLPALFRRSHLLVVPSLWPEPFGVVGQEAGAYGLPAAAYAVGGIPDWLKDGVNGHLAPGHPPTADGLADAIVKCLGDHSHYGTLRRGARAQTESAPDVAYHVASLIELLERVGRRAGTVLL
jgi:glycosyltransferase involved in cell wall biosynthesis